MSDSFFNPGDEVLYSEKSIQESISEARKLAKDPDFGSLSYTDYRTYKKGDKLAQKIVKPVAATPPTSANSSVVINSIKGSWAKWYREGFEPFEPETYGIGYLPTKQLSEFGNITPTHEHAIHKIYVYDLGSLSEGNDKRSVTRHQITWELLHWIKRKRQGNTMYMPGEYPVAFNGSRYIPADITFLKSPDESIYRQGQPSISLPMFVTRPKIEIFTHGEIFQKPFTRDTLVVSFCPENPIRQILAGICMNTKEEDLPRVVILDGITEVGTGKDRPTSRVKEWLAKYHQDAGQLLAKLKPPVSSGLRTYVHELEGRG